MSGECWVVRGQKEKRPICEDFASQCTSSVPLLIACALPLDSAFSAFPDTSLFAEGHISYSFKIRAPAEDGDPESDKSYFDASDIPKPSTGSTPMKSSPGDRDSGFFGPVTEVPETPLSDKTLPSKGETADEYRKWDERGRKWLYGYVWFQQRKDKSIVRGYMQVSLDAKTPTCRAADFPMRYHREV